MKYKLIVDADFNNPETGKTEVFKQGTLGDQVPDADLSAAERACLRRTQREIEPRKAVAIRLGGRVRVLTVDVDVVAHLEGTFAMPRRAPRAG